MQFLLDASDSFRFGEEGGYQSIGDVFKNGGPAFILGVLTVFSVLAIIWGVLELFHLFCYTLPEKKKKRENPVPAFVPLPVTTPVTPSNSAKADDAQRDEEIVAVIAAAIAAATAERPSGEFKVVSFRRK